MTEVKEKEETKADSQGWALDGSFWKDDVGLKYYLTKSLTTICPGLVAEASLDGTKTTPDAEECCDTAVSNGITHTTDPVTEKIRVLASQGKSCRAIESDLAKDGVTMSYRTINRRLQGVLL